MFFKKLQKHAPYYWEEKSYLMVVPKDDGDDLLKNALNNLESSKEFKVLSTKTDIASQAISLNIKYKKLEYDVGVYEGGVNIPEFYLNGLYISDAEKDLIRNAKKSLTIYMPFNNNPKEAFHLQLKLACIMVPDLIALMDESAERVFVSDWVKMAASSKYTPSSKDLYSIQAVMGDDNSVWLHTHGLSRCGLTELEILGSTKENSRNHYNLINSYAMYLLDSKSDDNFNGDYIGRLINGDPVVVTSLIWTEALNEYKHIKIGGKKDRKNGHNSKTSVIFVYASEEDEKNNCLSKISIYDNLWGDNPLFFFSDEETERMKNVAIERFKYVKLASKNKDNTILLKIGLPLEEKGKYEHIWFELLEFKGEKFKAKLTQEPYYFPDIHEGYEAWYKLEDLTDWIIYTEYASITPDNAYILDKKKK